MLLWLRVKAFVAVSAGLLFALLIAGLLAPPVEAQTENANALNLTPEERAWVVAHPVLRTAAVPDWPPFDYVTADGVYEGINADMLRRIARLAGFTIDRYWAP